MSFKNLMVVLALLITTPIGRCDEAGKQSPADSKIALKVTGLYLNDVDLAKMAREAGILGEKQIREGVVSDVNLKTYTEINDPKEQYEKLESVQWQRKRQAEVLKVQLRSSKVPAACAAAFLIGELALKDDLPDLVDRIEIATEVRLTRPGSSFALWSRYPALEALVKFGLVAAPNIIDGIARTEGNDGKALLEEALCQVAGNRGAIAMLTDAHNLERDAKRKTARLDALESILKRDPEKPVR